MLCLGCSVSKQAVQAVLQILVNNHSSCSTCLAIAWSLSLHRAMHAITCYCADQIVQVSCCRPLSHAASGCKFSCAVVTVTCTVNVIVRTSTPSQAVWLCGTAYLPCTAHVLHCHTAVACTTAPYTVLEPNSGTALSMQALLSAAFLRLCAAAIVGCAGMLVVHSHPKPPS